MAGWWGATKKELPEQSNAPDHVPQLRWSPKVFEDIEWRRFEALCEALFSQAGMRTESKSHGADGGVDIWLYSAHSAKPMIVQCKHWRRKPVGVQQLREFFGVLKANDLQYGTFATSSTFTAEALVFAKANGINAQDRSGLLRLIGGRTFEQQSALLTVAYEGEYWRPTCANCGVKMIDRKPKGGGAAFWGCVNYGKTRCRFKLYASSGAD
jgi:restriction system protein